jgi:hypothetical protein
MRISGRQIDDCNMSSSRRDTGSGRWCSGHRCRRLWNQLFAVVGRRCTCSFASPACQQIVCAAIFARKASWRVVLTKHSQVSFNCSLHLVRPRKLNTSLLLLSDIGARFLDSVLCFLYCGAQKLSFGHVGHVQGSDCSSCTRRPCLAIIADMSNTYKKLIAASNNEMQLLPQWYTLP